MLKRTTFSKIRVGDVVNFTADGTQNSEENRGVVTAFLPSYRQAYGGDIHIHIRPIEVHFPNAKTPRVQRVTETQWRKDGGEICTPESLLAEIQVLRKNLKI